MNDLEARIRDVLHEDANRAPFVGTMPEQVRPRIRRRQAATVLAASLASVALIAGSVFAVRSFDRGAITPGVTQPTDPPPPMAFPVADGPVALQAGTYLVSGALASESSPPSYTVSVPDGWMSDGDSDLKKNEDTPQVISIVQWALDEIGIFEDACRGELGDPPAPASVAELVSALRSQESGPIVSNPVTTSLGGLPATRVDLDYPDRMSQAGCRVGRGQLQLWGSYFVFHPNHTASLYVVGVAGGAQLLLVVDTADGASAADRAELQSILDSVRFVLAE